MSNGDTFGSEAHDEELERLRRADVEELDPTDHKLGGPASFFSTEDGRRVETYGRKARIPLFESAVRLPSVQQLRVYKKEMGKFTSLGPIDAEASEEELIHVFYKAMPAPHESATFKFRPINAITGQEMNEEWTRDISGSHLTLQELRETEPDTPAGMFGGGMLGLGRGGGDLEEALLGEVTTMFDRQDRLAQARIQQLEEHNRELARRAEERERQAAELNSQSSDRVLNLTQTMADRQIELERSRSKENIQQFQNMNGLQSKLLEESNTRNLQFFAQLRADDAARLERERAEARERLAEETERRRAEREEASRKFDEQMRLLEAKAKIERDEREAREAARREEDRARRDAEEARRREEREERRRWEDERRREDDQRRQQQHELAMAQLNAQRQDADTTWQRRLELQREERLEKEAAAERRAKAEAEQVRLQEAARQREHEARMRQTEIEREQAREHQERMFQLQMQSNQGGNGLGALGDMLGTLGIDAKEAFAKGLGAGDMPSQVLGLLGGVLEAYNSRQSTKKPVETEAKLREQFNPGVHRFQPSPASHQIEAKPEAAPAAAAPSPAPSPAPEVPVPKPESPFQRAQRVDTTDLAQKAGVTLPQVKAVRQALRKAVRVVRRAPEKTAEALLPALMPLLTLDGGLEYVNAVSVLAALAEAGGTEEEAELLVTALAEALPQVTALLGGEDIQVIIGTEEGFDPATGGLPFLTNQTTQKGVSNG